MIKIMYSERTESESFVLGTNQNRKRGIDGRRERVNKRQVKLIKKRRRKKST